MFQSFTFGGRLTKDPELRYLEDGTPVGNFSVAVNWQQGENEKTMFVRVTVWRGLAENCNDYLAKGDRVVIPNARIDPADNGNPPTWEAQDGTRTQYEVTAFRVKFIDMSGPMAGGGEREHDDDEEEDYSDIPF